VAIRACKREKRIAKKGGGPTLKKEFLGIVGLDEVGGSNIRVISRRKGKKLFRDSLEKNVKASCSLF